MNFNLITRRPRALVAAIATAIMIALSLTPHSVTYAGPAPGGTHDKSGSILVSGE